MIKALMQRLCHGLLVLWVLYTLSFFLIKALPYGPFQSEKAMPEHILQKREAYLGLNQSPWQQYQRTMGQLLRGNLDSSWRLEGRAVSDIIGQALPVSLQLGVAAFALAIILGIPAGVIAAKRARGGIDALVMLTALLGICLPSFVLGPLLAELIGRQWHLVPVLGWNAADPSTWFLPALTLGLANAAYLARLTRAGMLETLQLDFVRTARAKGLPEHIITWKHCLRGGLIPACAYLGPAFAGVISGSVVIETVFQIPGLGRHFIKAIETNDQPVLLSIVLLYGSFIILGNLFSDLLQLWLNPRLRS